MNQASKFLITGNAGNIECLCEHSLTQPKGLAILGHPHPLYGGTMDNKVVEIMARTFLSLDFAVARLNFRGVGRSQGQHDHGIGETDDMAALLAHLRPSYPNLPLVLGGFSFGTYVASRLQEKLMGTEDEVKQLFLVSTTAGMWSVDRVPANTVLIHGELDTLVPLSNVFDWARPQDLTVHVVPGADHLFNRKLHHITRNIKNSFLR